MDASLQSGTLLAGRYRILARIGEGGFGTVYKARDRHQHGKLVAIKEINMATLSPQEKIEVTDSFNREITLLSRLEHKHLPRIHTQYTDPEHWYIVMDYIEGQTLEELLARFPKGRLPLNQVAKIGIALCDVLSHLHNQSPSIIYRDVKPSNIMLTPWGRLYLIDFGIARRYRPGQPRDPGHPPAGYALGGASTLETAGVAPPDDGSRSLQATAEHGRGQNCSLCIECHHPSLLAVWFSLHEFLLPQYEPEWFHLQSICGAILAARPGRAGGL